MSFFAIVDDQIRRLPVDRAAQRMLTSMFTEQAAEFLEARSRVAFDGQYTVDETEVFEIPRFDLPTEIAEAVKNPQQPEKLDISADGRIRSIFGGEYNSSSRVLKIAFQNFNQGRVLRSGFTLLAERNTLRENRKAGITLDTKLAGVFIDGDLMFRNYRNMNSVIDISEFYEEATNEQIAELLEHERVHVPDADAVYRHMDSWMRRRFTAVLQSGVLDSVKPRVISRRAKKYGVTVKTKKVDDRTTLIMPGEKKEIKTLLTFLSEGYFEGELTGTLFQTNSQRKVT